MSISSDEFKAALSRFASGVTVVTTKDAAGMLYGITVSAFCSVSLDPPLVLVSISKNTGSHHAFGESGAFVVNVLSESQQEISNHFASHNEDKFSGFIYDEGIDGLPILRGCLVNLECRLKHSYDGGDHTIFIGEIEKSAAYEGGPLLYFHGAYRKLA